MRATIGKLGNKKQDRILDGCVEELQNRRETDNWIKDILDIEAAIEDKIANLGLKQLKQAIIGDAAIRSVLHEKPCLRVVYTSKAC